MNHIGVGPARGLPPMPPSATVSPNTLTPPAPIPSSATHLSPTLPHSRTHLTAPSAPTSVSNASLSLSSTSLQRQPDQLHASSDVQSPSIDTSSSSSSSSSTSSSNTSTDSAHAAAVQAATNITNAVRTFYIQRKAKAWLIWRALCIMCRGLFSCVLSRLCVFSPIRPLSLPTPLCPYTLDSSLCFWVALVRSSYLSDVMCA
jgi:hypothetical protein